MSKFIKKSIKKIGERKSFNKDVIMVFIAMISTLLVVIGTSYAVFNMVIISNKEHTVTSGNLTITFLETSQFIALNNAYPMTDIEGLNTKPYNITITNTGTINAKYRIYLEDDKTIQNIVPKNLLKISYKEGTSNYTTPSLISSLEEESIIVKDRSLNVGNSINYEFKIWLDINATNSEQGKTYKSKVVVESVQSLGDYSDTISPVIKLNGELNTNISKGGTFTDSGVLSVEDDKDKTLTTSNVTKTYEYFNGTTTTSVANINTNNIGVYFIYYKIKDNANNEGLVVRTVSVNDNTPPTITLIGNAVMEVTNLNGYVEPGFTAISSKGININKNVITIGDVNIINPKLYIIKYIAIDENNQMTAITRTVNVTLQTYNFNYTGASQAFTVSKTGTYKVELWGANGNNSFNAYTKTVPSYGGYVSGSSYFEKNTILYVYVGGQRQLFNCCSLQNSYAGSGGATDVRLTNGMWDNFDSLKSRIIVAGGAGGSYGDSSATGGGSAGGLNSIAIYHLHFPVASSTQLMGGTAGYTGTAGGFGYGGININGSYNSGAGGYYGGGSGPGGGGGSSFISGHNGCDAIASNSTQTNIIHTHQSNHYSGKTFSNTTMIDGLGYKWTNVKGKQTQMPKPNGTLYPVGQGNDGNGYAKITLISK